MKEGWEYKKLGEVCEIFDKQRKPVTKSARTNGVYPYYGATGIQDYVADYIFDGRFVLIGEDGAKWGACENTAFIIEGKSWVNNHAHIIKFDSNIIDSFAVYFLNFSNLDSFISGAVVRKLTQASMKNIVLPLPPLSQQQSIVAELDKINEIIDLKKAQLKDLDLLAQSIFYDMFGDPIENPKGWEVKKLEEVCKLSQGLAINKQTKHYLSDIPTSIPLLRIKDMKDGTREIFVKEDDCPTSCMAYPDDIIYTRTGTLGLAFTNMYGIMHNNCFKIVTNEELVKVFFMNYIQGEWFKSNITRLASRSSQPDITHKLFLSQSIILPPLSLQQSFAEKIQAIESQKSAIKQSLAEAETLLASRMDYWFG